MFRLKYQPVPSPYLMGPSRQLFLLSKIKSKACGWNGEKRRDYGWEMKYCKYSTSLFLETWKRYERFGTSRKLKQKLTKFKTNKQTLPPKCKISSTEQPTSILTAIYS